MVTKEGITSPGWMMGVGSTGTASTLITINTALRKVGFALLPRASKTISGVKFNVNSVGGTLGAGDIKVEVYSDNGAQAPNASMSSTTTVTATPTGAALVEATGLSQAVTAGTPVWLVISNVNATPAVNNFVLLGGASDTNANIVGGTGSFSVYGTRKQTDDGGTTWTAASVSSTFAIIITYSDGSVDGICLSGIATEVTANTVYAARELGNLFTYSGIARLRVSGITFFPAKTGTPTGNMLYKLYEVDTGLSYLTVAIAPALITTAFRAVPLYFNEDTTNFPVLNPGYQYRAVIAESSQSDTSANRYTTAIHSISNNATVLGQKGFNGTLQKTYNNAGWTETPTDFVPFYLLGSNLTPSYPGLRQAFQSLEKGIAA